MQPIPENVEPAAFSAKSSGARESWSMAGEKASEEHSKRPTALDEFISIDVYDMWGKRNERPNVGGVFIRNRNGAPSRKRCVVNGYITESSNKSLPPPLFK